MSSSISHDLPPFLRHVPFFLLSSLIKAGTPWCYVDANCAGATTNLMAWNLGGQWKKCANTKDKHAENCEKDSVPGVGGVPGCDDTCDTTACRVQQCLLGCAGCGQGSGAESGSSKKTGWTQKGGAVKAPPTFGSATASSMHDSGGGSAASMDSSAMPTAAKKSGWHMKKVGRVKESTTTAESEAQKKTGWHPKKTGAVVSASSSASGSGSSFAVSSKLKKVGHGMMKRGSANRLAASMAKHAVAKKERQKIVPPEPESNLEAAPEPVQEAVAADGSGGRRPEPPPVLGGKKCCARKDGTLKAMKRCRRSQREVEISKCSTTTGGKDWKNSAGVSTKKRRRKKKLTSSEKEAQTVRQRIEKESAARKFAVPGSPPGEDEDAV